MASWKEIERIRKDARGFRALAKQLLTHTAPDGLTGWETTFLAEVVERTTSFSEYTTRQSEKLLQIRDDTQLLEKVGVGFSVVKLIDGCYLGRVDLTEDQEAWIANLKQRGTTAIRRRDAGKLLRCATILGLIETEAA